jgi:hypothetical protein
VGWEDKLSKKNATLKTKKRAYLNLKRHDGPGCEIGKT